ncbi:hypothetical protein RB25_25850 [Herbaspirillum rubrisubalbicans]|uniref:Uncharacterized protein n=1 Tax=Herbaspirillum rubrisubalbicans TaxID=80842 RepID=A0ABX9BVU4_9BURK|nr:hypothetical protein [Herbaspirillum rubrisubalbicans]NQE51832.1 hypothetical protein [Herbaspirillum rubrisubalbicans]RAM61946.1 hypothetical protein RB24_23300 [Herbaspirillum rubrisubalbicans]RAN42509.1 hypothetical protein RB25_25850 [Herbaspirillum rubrisubalbicans]
MVEYQEIIRGMREVPFPSHGKPSCEGEMAVSAERHLSQLRDSVRKIVELFTAPEAFDDAASTYDAGIASGFYGKRAAISQGFRKSLADRLWSLRRARRRGYVNALRKVYAVGYAQGENIGMDRGTVTSN